MVFRMDNQFSRLGDAGRYPADLTANLHIAMRFIAATALLLSGTLATAVLAEQWTSTSGHTTNVPFAGLDEDRQTLTILVPLDVAFSKLSPFSIGRAKALAAKTQRNPPSENESGALEQWISSDGHILNAPFVKIDEMAETVTILTPKEVSFSRLDPQSLKRARELAAAQRESESQRLLKAPQAMNQRHRKLRRIKALVALRFFHHCSAEAKIPHIPSSPGP